MTFKNKAIKSPAHLIQENNIFIEEILEEYDNYLSLKIWKIV